MKDIAVSSYFLPIISAERELIGNNKLFLIFSYLSREARTYIGGNKEKRINKWKIYGLGCNFPQWRINPSMVIKGNRNKEKVLMDEFLATQKEYDKKRKARKNGKKQKTVKG